MTDPRSTALPAKPNEHSFEDTVLWRIKVKLQFTGWLQYMPNAMAALLMLVLSAAGWLIGVGPGLLIEVPLGLATLLAANLLFDLATVRYGLHPAEPLPRDKRELDAFELMRSRVSCRSFQSRNMTRDHHAELLETVREYSRPEYLLGTRPIRFEYVEARLTVWPVVGAHEFLVAIAPKEYNRPAIIDVGRSLQKIVLHATRMGLATCWIGPGADQKSVIEHLGDRFDPARDHVICVCAVGYASRYKPVMLRLMQLSQRRRLPVSELFFADPWHKEPLDTGAAPFRVFGRCYEVCRWSPSSYNSQTTRCAAVTNMVDGQRVLERFDFGAINASRYYAAVAVGIWLANWETGCDALGIGGHFAVLPPETRGTGDEPALLRYDMSWIPDA